MSNPDDAERWHEAVVETTALRDENARLRGDLDTALGLRRMESRRVDTVRDQAEALAAALETALYYAEMYAVWLFDRGKVADARAALRAYREGPIVHCWADRGEAEGRPGATCMAPAGHAGPHDWVPDSSIRVSFSASDAGIHASWCEWAAGEPWRCTCGARP